MKRRRLLQPIAVELGGRRYELTPAQARELLLLLNCVATPGAETPCGPSTFTASDDAAVVWKGEEIPVSVAQAREARDLLALALRAEAPS